MLRHKPKYLNGQTELHATLRGPLKNKSQLEAHLGGAQLSLNYKNTIQLRTAGPIRADYTQSTLNVQRSVIHGTGTELTFQANIPATKDAPVKMPAARNSRSTVGPVV